MMHPRILILTTVALLVSTGCAAVTDDDPFAVPQPFQGAERNDTMLKQAIEVPALIVELPQGLTAERAQALRAQVVSVARQHDVPALTESTALAWVLSAQLAIVSHADEKVLSGERTVLSWRLCDAGGTERAQFSVSFDGNEASLNDAGIALLAAQTVAALDSALARPGTQVGESPTATGERPLVWIGPVKGAPGDGNQALTRALQGVLPLKGVRVGPARHKAQWRIEGQIKVVRASATQDTVTLVWRVFDAKGKEAGNVRQENAVPHGRLGKSWGEIAGFAAEAAAEGIAQLIQQVSAAKPA